VLLSAFVLVVALMAAPLTAQAPQAGKVPRVALVTNTAPEQSLTDSRRRGPVLAPSFSSYASSGG
jgi:hypothetical protein